MNNICKACNTEVLQVDEIELCKNPACEWYLDPRGPKKPPPMRIAVLPIDSDESVQLD